MKHEVYLSMMQKFCLPIRVYVEDTDAGGIVYYANYLKYIERARTELIRTFGFDKPALFGSLQFVVHSLSVKYLQSAVLDDEIIFNSGLRLMNENVYIENSYKLKFQSYIHTSYSKRLIDKERGYWEILNEW